MIKTLKSELKLKPTYDEMIGMIEAQGDENRPSIETVINRRATLFRNNQFGSQFDNIDFLGLKKQEEDRAKEEVRQAQLRQAGIMAGTSSGTLTIRTSGFSTPAEVYEAMDDDDDMTSEEMTRIRAEMERYLQRQREAQQETASSVASDLDEAHRQTLPVGVEFHRMNTGGTDASAEASRGSRDDLPPLIDIPREDITDIPAEVRLQQPSSASSGKLTDIVVSGAKAGVETLARAGATALAKSFLPV